MRDLNSHPIVILDNVRSAHNVGGIFRTADSAGVERIDLCGMTPRPPNPKLAKTALGAESVVPWRCFGSAIEAATEARLDGRTVVAIETASDARDLFDCEIPNRAALLVGHEVFGISPEVLALADILVRIPMLGAKSSLNVATALGIVVFELVRRSREGE